SPESLRSGAAQTRPVEYRYDSSSCGLFLTAHAMTVLPATLASARPTRTACTASVCVPKDSTFQPIFPSRSRAQESYADPLFTKIFFLLGASACRTWGDLFLTGNGKWVLKAPSVNSMFWAPPLVTVVGPARKS